MVSGPIRVASAVVIVTTTACGDAVGSCVTVSSKSLVLAYPGTETESDATATSTRTRTRRIEEQVSRADRCVGTGLSGKYSQRLL